MTDPYIPIEHMKENIEDINADIELQYGQRNMERNIAYILSLVEARLKEDGELDDRFPCRRSKRPPRPSYCS